MKKIIKTYVAVKPSGPATFGIALMVYSSEVTHQMHQVLQLVELVQVCHIKLPLFPPLSL